ncbi:MAG: binary toxin-like calcium binding domain-containing protein [Verrucomicrobiota bacterium]|nr:binary toxin-like calcium binding domain-containing protein [Verrucomicrobiota bacterium]
MNIDEYLNTTDPTNPDTDADGIPDGWEAQYALDMKSNDSQNDPDNDDLTNLAEYANSTDPNNPDTDADGLPDGWEVENNFNPLSVADGYADDDNDFLSNREEYKNSTDYDNPDTDGDGLTDFEEIMTYHTDPLQISSFPLVNNKEQYTNSQTVSIKTFGPEATGIRVSLNRDMTDSTLFPNAGTEIVEYTLPEIDGQYFIYIDFYKNEESQSDIFTYRIILDTHEPIIQIESPLDGTTVQQLYVDLKAQMNSGVRYDKP